MEAPPHARPSSSEQRPHPKARAQSVFTSAYQQRHHAACPSRRARASRLRRPGSLIIEFNATGTQVPIYRTMYS